MRIAFRRLIFVLPLATCGFTATIGFAQTEPEPQKTDAPAVLAGHSYHGEAFNEGPRQKAYLMGGTGPVNFPVTTKSPEAQQFINQGLGQVYGFWYFEAERSFRQAAALDPDCAMAYWGMALANVNNDKRAEGFIAKAMERKEKASPRERMYIEARNTYLKGDAKKKKERSEVYAKALEKIYYKFPEDIEAKALLGQQMWLNRDAGVPIASNLAYDALLKEVLAVQPMHPVHHFRIHHWDYEKADNSLDAAALCGQAAPSIAHMWHMPGHIYSKTERYADAAWQQEASTRVDHAHMMRDRVLPDQIHNFAHNNEWLIRDLMHVGRVRDALSLAKNMIELPRHPKYNTLKKGSSNFGRMRLFDVLTKYELWHDLIALANSPYLEPTDDDAEQVKRLRMLGRAYFRSGDAEMGKAQLAQIEERLQKEKEGETKAATAAETKARDEKKDDKQIEQAKTDAKKPFTTKIQTLEKAADELKGHAAVARGEFKEAIELLKKSASGDDTYLARVQLLAGDKDAAEKTARDFAGKHKHEVQPWGALVEILWQLDKKKDAGETFEQLRQFTYEIDLQSPVFGRLAPIAKELGAPEDWRNIKTPTDTGNRPSLDSLGPFRWSPSPAPQWTLRDADDKEFSLAQYRGKPVIVMFYLGSGCLHCAEQLQAFAGKANDFYSAGISLVAVSTDDRSGLQTSLKNFKDGHFAFPLVSNPQHEIFKAYRAFDDFENVPLHGTFLIDGHGLVRWQDISYQPFKEADFLLQESKRLLSQPTPATAAVAQK